MTAGPRLSVVVASSNARTTITDCLATTTEQCERDHAELIVVDNSTDGTAAIIGRDFPEARVLSADPSALIPELWEHGILESRAELVAITTAHCVPTKTWVQEILRAHAEGEAAVGGAIENAESADTIDWAIYLCRYSGFMLPFEGGPVAELAGDNASYRRAHLDACREAWVGGFWEPGVHAQLKSRRIPLRLDPDIVVYHTKSFRMLGFVAQRLRHGMAFGREHAGRLSPARRIAHIALAPTVPLVLLLRIGRRVVGKRRHRGRLFVCLPVLLLFLLAWTAGELVGHIRGPERRH